MIHIMSAVSSIINFRNPCKDFECFLARFYLAQFLMNGCTVSGLVHTRTLIWWLSLYERGPSEQRVYETHLTNVPAGSFLPCAEWTLLHEPTSRKSGLSAFEQQRLGPYSCVLSINFFLCIWGWPRACAGLPGEDVLGTSSSLGFGLICWIGAKHPFVRFLPGLMWPDFKRLCCPSPATLWPRNRRSYDGGRSEANELTWGG